MVETVVNRLRDRSRSFLIVLLLFLGVAFADSAFAQGNLPAVPGAWWLAPIGSLFALAAALYFYKSVMKQSEGTEKMREIAQAVREGAMAYLRQQYKIVTRHHNTISRLTTCMLLALLAGCSAAVRQSSKTSLEFLEYGKTTKDMVRSKLGPPTGTFEGDRIISYRLGKTKEGYFVSDRVAYPYEPVAPAWLSGIEGKFSLVLIFDENQILQKHSLVQVK